MMDAKNGILRIQCSAVSLVLALMVGTCFSSQSQHVSPLIWQSARHICKSASIDAGMSQHILKDRQSLIGELNAKFEAQPGYNRSVMSDHINAFLSDDQFRASFNNLYSNPDLVNKYNYLTRSEMAAIKLYTKSSVELNALLRGGMDRAVSKQYEESVLNGWAYILRHAVETLTDQQVIESGFKVYRVVSKAEADLIVEAYEHTGIIKFQEFKSSSSGLDISDILDLREDGGLVTINNPKGADISDFSNHPEEKEFLILGPGEFKITNISQSLVGPYIYLDQLG